MDKYYKVPKKILLDLLETRAKMNILEADGVDNWSWYLAGLVDYIMECFPDKTIEELETYDLEDCAYQSLQDFEEIKV